MRFKKIMFFMLLVSIFALTGCGGKVDDTTKLENQENKIEESQYEKDSLEYTVDVFLKNYQANNIDVLSSYMADGICSIDAESINQNESTELTWKCITENFKFEILNAEEKDETAKVNVKMSNIYMSDVMINTFMEYNTLDIAMNYNASQEEVVSAFNPILKKYIVVPLTLYSSLSFEYSNKDRLEKTVSVDLIKEDGKWKIVNDTAVFDIMTGEYISFVSRDLKNFSAIQ